MPTINNKFITNHLKQRTLNAISPTYTESLVFERGLQIEAIFEQNKGKTTFSKSQNSVDFSRMVGQIMLANQEFAEETCWLMTKNGHKDFGAWYERMVKKDYWNQMGLANLPVIDKTRAADPIDVTTYAGDEDFAETLVEKAIAKRIEGSSAIFDFIQIKRAPGIKAKKITTISSNFAATYVAAGAPLPDMTDDTTGAVAGVGNVTIEAHKVGVTFDFELEATNKLDPYFVLEFANLAQLYYERGVRRNIYTGAGTTVFPLGLATNATSVLWQGTGADTLTKMLAAVADQAKASEGYFAVTNTTGATVLLREKLNNQSFDINIQFTGEGLGNGRVMGLPLVIDDAIVSAGTSPAVTAPLYVGAKNHYIHLLNTDAKLEFDPFGNFKTGMQIGRVMGINGGRPLFNNSFAKTTLPSIY